MYHKRIKALRKERHYTQLFVATVLNVSQTTYSDYEHGYVRIPLMHLIELAKLYDVDMNYISGISDVRNHFPTKKHQGSVR